MGGRERGGGRSSKKGIAPFNSFICFRLFWFFGYSSREKKRERDVHGDDHNIRSTGENKNEGREGREDKQKKQTNSPRNRRRNTESRKCARRTNSTQTKPE